MNTGYNVLGGGDWKEEKGVTAKMRNCLDTDN